MRSPAIGLALAVLLLCPQSSIGHSRAIVRNDPPGDAFVDVHRTRRALIHVADHHRIRIGVRVAELPPLWRVRVWVDVRGDEVGDVLLFASRILGDPKCGARTRSGDRLPERCDSFSSSTKLWWSLRRAVLRPTKPIRWQIRTYDPMGLEPDSPDDRAPDTGWYP